MPPSPPRPNRVTGTILPDEAATIAYGAALASTLGPGDIVALIGDLGAGKSTLARAVIRALAGDPGLEVPSPTFSLVQPYDAGGRAVLHADLYRLADASEADELGLLDDPEAIVVVEWPERAPSLLDRATRIVNLAPEPGGGRIVSVRNAGQPAAE